jgi:hypothetical protein
VLIDGHNRFEICTKWNLDYKIHIVNYETLDQAKDFMIDNQLGRRNITPEQASYLRGLKYNSEKKNRGQYDREMQSGQNVHFGQVGQKKTAQKLAEQYNVNEKTIRRDADYATGIELLPIEIKSEVLTGKSNLSKNEIIELGKITDKSEIENKINQLINRENREIEGNKNKQIKNKIIALIKTLTTQEELDEIIKEIKIIKKSKG